MAAIPIRLHEAFADDHRVYKVHFFGSVVTTTVTSNADVISGWIHTIANFLKRFAHPVVGVGAQWYYLGPSPAAVVQLNVGKRCLIIQLSHCRDVPKSLRNFLKNRRYTFVGIWNHSDARRLKQSHANLRFRYPPLDLRKHLETREGESLRSKSFEKIVEKCLGYSGARLDRKIGLSFWEDRYLSIEQVRQATVDAHASFKIGRDYRAWEFK